MVDKGEKAATMVNDNADGAPLLGRGHRKPKPSLLLKGYLTSCKQEKDVKKVSPSYELQDGEKAATMVNDNADGDQTVSTSSDDTTTTAPLLGRGHRKPKPSLLLKGYLTSCKQEKDISSSAIKSENTTTTAPLLGRGHRKPKPLIKKDVKKSEEEKKDVKKLEEEKLLNIHPEVSAETYSPSYKLQDTTPSHHHWDKLGKEVLNDRYIFCKSVGGSREVDNPFEEKLFECEDQRFELDMLLAYAKSTIKTVSKIMSEEVKPNTLKAQGRRLIENIYNGHGIKVLEMLNKSPLIVSPIILARLYQKQEEWETCLSEFNQTWGEVYAKNIKKSIAYCQKKSKDKAKA